MRYAISLLLLALTVRYAAAIPAPSPDPNLVYATIGGVVVETVAPGDRVAEGDPLVYVRTATKSREVAARAPRDAVVAEVLVQVGVHIRIGDPVVRLRPR